MLVFKVCQASLPVDELQQQKNKKNYLLLFQYFEIIIEKSSSNSVEFPTLNVFSNILVPTLKINKIIKEFIVSTNRISNNQLFSAQTL